MFALTETMTRTRDKGKLRWLNANPALIVGIYALCSGAYIVFSDTLVAALAGSPQLITFVSEAKGLVFILATSWLIYALLLRAQTETRAARDAHDQLQRASNQILDTLPVSVLISDPSGVVTHVNRFALSYSGYAREQLLGRSIKDITKPVDLPLVEKVMAKCRSGDIVDSVLRMIHGDGSEVPYRLHATGLSDASGRITGLVGAGFDISQELEAERRIRESFKGLEGVLDQTVAVISKIIEMRDPYIGGHQTRVTELALRIADRLALPENLRHGLRLASLCHDIGKVYVPAEILSKPGKLTLAEFAMIKTHPQVGFEILSKVDFPWPVAQIVQQHHERFDGSGYPRGLTGEQTRLEARIIGVSDVVESMQSHRPYRPALGLAAALAEIRQNRGRLYDPAVVDACIAVFEQDKFEFSAQIPD
jgi:PAS domain S-box-containing protein/putative nucleotidyltransferase with HDIG domain